MVGKSEMKSPQQNKGNGEKEEKSKDIKQEENRGQRNRERENGPYPHQGRGHRGGRGGHFGGPGARAEGGPRATGGRDRGERGQYNADQAQVSLEDALPPADKKFTGRCRLFVGNLPTDTSEEEFKKMFEPYGESTEVFLNAARGFGFIRMVTIIVKAILVSDFVCFIHSCSDVLPKLFNFCAEKNLKRN